MPVLEFIERGNLIAEAAKLANEPLPGVMPAAEEAWIRFGQGLAALRVRGQIRFLEEDLLRYLSTCGVDKHPAPQPEPRQRYKRPAAPRKPRSIPPEEMPPQLRYIPGMKVV